MANVWISLILLILVHDVFAVICPTDSKNIRNCDECLRCGGKWCSETNGPHCAYTQTDMFCDGHAEKRPVQNTERKSGTELRPNYVGVTAYVGSTRSLDFTYSASEYRKVQASIINSTQNNAILLRPYAHDCKIGTDSCKMTINAEVEKDFCTATGTIDEFIYVKVQVQNVIETATIKYHVPCACACSKDSIRSAAQCSSHGDFACGVCLCHDGWCGDICETKVEVKSERCNKNGDYACGSCICEEGWCGTDCKYAKERKERKSPLCNKHGDFACGNCNCHWGWEGNNCTIKQDVTCDDYKIGEDKNHGDVPCHSGNPLFDNVECSGNGYCSLCDRCICYDDMTNSRYFDGYCSDICMETRGCDFCITNGTLGECTVPQGEHCLHRITMLAYNTTVAEEEDENGRIWLPCNGSFTAQDSECNVDYVAMRDDSGISIMVVRSCYVAEYLPTYVPGETKVPIILGVLFLIAAVVAVAGYMAWKHFGKTPTPYFNVGDEKNIGGENCVGENPLYKNPTSTFTNPQYGKC